MTRLAFIILSAALFIQSAAGIGMVIDFFRMRDLVRDTLELAEGWKKIALQADADGCDSIRASMNEGRAP
jgi:hypothetical protein